MVIKIKMASLQIIKTVIKEIVLGEFVPGTSLEIIDQEVSRLKDKLENKNTKIDIRFVPGKYRK
jgi:hypothetical protein